MREPITYNDLKQVKEAFEKHDTNCSTFFWCYEWNMLYDSDIEKLYPRSKIKRIRIARKSKDRYLVTWRGLQFHLIQNTLENDVNIFNAELQILKYKILNALRLEYLVRGINDLIKW